LRGGIQPNRDGRVALVWQHLKKLKEHSMSAPGLDVFDKTLPTTQIWLDDIMKDVGPDRQVAWHSLGAVLRVLRDRLRLPPEAHLGAQLPLRPPRKDRQ
jgi:hypothetical protein